MKRVLIVRHVEHEGPGTIAGALSRADLEYHLVDGFARSEFAFDPNEAAGLVVLGGPMNVDEVQKYPHLAVEVRWIQQAIEAELPMLGICLGSQLLAKALGARVYPAGSKEIGWYPIEMTAAAADDFLLAPCAAQPVVFQWHGDTFDLPNGAVHLASSPVAKHQAFRYGANAWGLQFHLEVTGAIVEEWLGEPGNCAELAELPSIDAERIRQRTPQELPNLQKIAAEVFDRFATMCREAAGRS